ncbi:MAG: glucosamine-1-phosphate N-acetyltransferase [Clostridia bacterium]|nr:glucosamine-1-phosphate N-acetyltransferase [Clostridia bacterium]
MTAVVFMSISRRSAAVEILSYPVLSYMIDACSCISDKIYCDAALDGIDERASTFEDFSALCEEIKGSDRVLAVFAPAPNLSAETIKAFVEGDAPACLGRGKMRAAALVEPKDLTQSIMENDFPIVSIPDGEWLFADTPETVYAAQEQLRRRINMQHMKNGVYMVDPNSTHISPFAEIESGTTILPGCLIYGKSRIGKDCTIGPNCMLKNAIIGDNTSVNASQITDSSVGSNTTVGPFAYIRPKCKVGDNARIDDFVELKNSNIGNGTKVSHVTYIGDSHFGEKINVGCGVVTVNYDGKNKYRTTVGDNSFVGCNVNLVSPVKVGDGAYIAAGSTITEDIPENCLAIARERQTIKEGWAEKRRQDGKLK